jgi:hypothetical protein
MLYQQEPSGSLPKSESITPRPLLSNLKVASPCKVNWSTMDGDERIRQCHLCNQSVYNISSLTTDQAENLLREKEGGLCVRYYQRKDGTIMTKDCPVLGGIDFNLPKKGWSSLIFGFELPAAFAVFLGVLNFYLLFGREIMPSFMRSFLEERCEIHLIQGNCPQMAPEQPPKEHTPTEPRARKNG